MSVYILRGYRHDEGDAYIYGVFMDLDKAKNVQENIKNYLEENPPSLLVDEVDITEKEVEEYIENSLKYFGGFFVEKWDGSSSSTVWALEPETTSETD